LNHDYSDLKDQDERRVHDRSRVIVDVFFNGKDATGVASTKDISIGGFYMNTHADLPVGSVLLVRISLSGDTQLLCNAEVVYTKPGEGVGVRFQDLTEEAQALLENELQQDV
jgi:hypothetical protein